MKKKHRYRKNVIAEIINTERQYVIDLTTVCEKVRVPAAKILSPEDLENIFMNCNELLNWNKQFLEVMEVGYKGYNVDKKNLLPYKV